MSTMIPTPPKAALLGDLQALVVIGLHSLSFLMCTNSCGQLHQQQ